MRRPTLPNFSRPALVSLATKTLTLGVAWYVGEKLGAQSGAALGTVLGQGLAEVTKTYFGESGAASFQEAILDRKAHDPHQQIRNHDIHRVAGLALKTLIEVYPKDKPEYAQNQAWLTARLENFDARWNAFDLSSVPNLSFLQGRFVETLYQDGAEALFDSERLQDTEWLALLLTLLVGEHWQTLTDAAMAGFPEFGPLAQYVAEHYAPAFTYLLRHDTKAGYGVLLFLQSELLKQTGEIHASLKALVNPQPELTRFENLRAAKTQNVVYLFERRISPFHGYGETCDTLQTFLKGEGLRWARLTGRAGSGKSRVALELVRYAAMQNWQTGFLRRDHAFNAWESWTPTVATLIVVDYALHRKTHVGENEIGLVSLLVLLQERFASSQIPVRVLLVDRDREPYVWVRFFEGVSSVIHDDEHDAPALSLTPLAQHDRLTILHEELERLEFRIPPDLPAVLERLETRLKEPARPLFLLFAARGIAECGNEANWSAEGLVEVVLRLEQKHWYEANVDGTHLNALVLATLVGSCKLSALTNPQKLAAGLPLIGDDDQLTMLCALGDGYNDALGELTGIRPDLLGELLILRRLKGDFLLTGQLDRPNRERNKQQVIEQTKALVALAWELNPVAVAEYLDRTIEDYLFDPVYGPTVEILSQKPTTEIAVLFWNMGVAPRLLFEWAGRGMLDKARLYLAGIQDTSRALIAYAGGLTNATADATSVTKAKPYLDELRQLAKDNPENSAVLNLLFRGWTITSLKECSEEEWQLCAGELVTLAQQLSQWQDAVEEWGQLVQQVITHCSNEKTGRIFSQWFQSQ
ncbi:hypothetical protein [Armatimonas sp.]|uniref:hypothetical protein n=1 Tax=Armatimonas sp. TaxID=1872638 RepID=UPI003750111F